MVITCLQNFNPSFTTERIAINSHSCDNTNFLIGFGFTALLEIESFVKVIDFSAFPEFIHLSLLLSLEGERDCEYTRTELFKADLVMAEDSDS